LTLSRLDLDGIGSPKALAERIHEICADLPPDFDIAKLCAKLDIFSIKEIDTRAFEAALLMDEHKASGSILLARGRWPERRRFSIGHELGHFLIPTHQPRPGQPMSCSLDDLGLADTKSRDQHKRIEAEANRFAAALLMPPKRLRKAMTSLEPDLREIVALAKDFGVSKEAMARSYVEAHRATFAVVILHHGRIDRIYRPDTFPWIAAAIGVPVPADSLAASSQFAPREFTDIEECDPDVWFSDQVAARIEVATEQVLGQSHGYSMVLLRVEGDDF
jgi:Zn-dependent peptidase ImmA (M78 family)